MNRPQTILVTGSAGFIGFETCKLLLQSGYRVKGLDAMLDDLYPSTFKLIKRRILEEFENYSHLEVDLRQELSQKELEDVDVVIHLAAMPGLLKSWSSFRTYQDCNIFATFNLLESLKKMDSSIRLIHASTSSVYGKYAIGDETSLCNPISPYGVTKLAAEHLIASYQSNFGQRAAILRLFSVYGPGQRQDMAFDQMINKIKTGEEIVIFGDGSQIRSNTYVVDVAHAFLQGLIKDIEGTYNICGGETKSILDFISIASEIIDQKPILRFLDERPGDQAKTEGDASKFIARTGWTPKVTFENGVRMQVNSSYE